LWWVRVSKIGEGVQDLGCEEPSMIWGVKSP